jgi:outer membrane protein assembly factor BamB
MAMTDIGNIEVPRMPVMAGERVVAVGHAGQVHLLDLDTGKTLWTFKLTSEKSASACDGQPVAVSVADEIVLAASMGHVFALRLDDGTMMWHAQHPARGSGEMSLAVGAPGGDYVTRLES